MDLRTLARAYDRSAPAYDEAFRPLQRVKYRAMLEVLAGDPALAAAAARPGHALDAGGGTGLWPEWLRDAAEPPQPPRGALAERAWVVIDASVGMLHRARLRGLTAVAGDVAAPPFAARSCGIVAAFTSVLERKERALAALGALVAPGGLLLVTLLEAEALPAERVAAAAALRLAAGPAPAGQDRLYVLRRDS